MSRAAEALLEFAVIHAFARFQNKSWDTGMKHVLVLLAVLSLSVMSVCSSGSGSGSSIIPPVQAQAGYSNASVTGTYSIVFGNQDYSGLGSFVADGSGKITSGTVNINPGTGATCGYQVAGTYSLSSTASGTAAMTITPSAGNNAQVCGPAETLQFSIQAASQGATLLLNQYSTGNEYWGSAFRQ